tara:strand:+ start:1182 stop:1589 length:408 start_codon:yes stop_codon:yes gene_type:complete
MRQDKKIEEFSKFIIKEAGTEVPSNDFVNNVINTIGFEISKSTVTIYKPLINKQTWLLIGVVLIGLGIYVFASIAESSIMLQTIDVSFLNRFNSINIFEKMKLPTVFVFSSVLFSILVLVQLTVIKKFLNSENSI